MCEYDAEVKERRGRHGRTVPRHFGTNAIDNDAAFRRPPLDEKYRATQEALHGQETGWLNLEVGEWSASQDPRTSLPPAGDNRGIPRPSVKGTDPYPGFAGGR